MFLTDGRVLAHGDNAAETHHNDKSLMSLRSLFSFEQVWKVTVAVVNVICYMFCVKCHMSYVMCHMSSVYVSVNVAENVHVCLHVCVHVCTCE